MPRKAKKEEDNVLPDFNIGLVGHVDHGKTTLVKALSGKWTDTHSEEIKRGITIKLGYADTTIYACPKCKPPYNYTIKKKCPTCNSNAVPERIVSFIDAPGHESLMATMLSGATIMDGALLLVAANEPCPQPQTREHIMALEIIGIDKVLVIQNKIDIVSEEDARKNYEQIKSFLKGTKFEDAPILPLSAQHEVNIDVLLSEFQKVFTPPKRDRTKSPLMFVARSFDTNRPGIDPEKMAAGVLGGSMKQGVLKVGDHIEIRPGRGVEEHNQKVWKPIHTRIAELITGGSKVSEVGPGGSFGLLTELDSAVVKSDALTGTVVGHVGLLPPVLSEFTLQTHLLDRVVGSKEDLKVEPIKIGESLMLNVYSSATVGIVTKVSKEGVTMKLKLPVCADSEARVTISRVVGNRFRLIGYGLIQD